MAGTVNGITGEINSVITNPNYLSVSGGTTITECGNYIITYKTT